MLEARSAHPGRTARHHLLALAASNRLPARRVGEVIEIAGLAPVADRRVGGFSLGMGQRLGIAAALLGDPGVLLLDEPVNGLDPDGVRWIRTLVKDLAAEGRTVLMSSHLMSEMALTADHLVIIGRGRLLADTGMNEFIERHSTAKVRIATPEPERLRALLAAWHIEVEPDGAPGVLLAVGTTPADVGRLIADNGVTVYEMSTQRASLEEAFVRITEASVEYRAGSVR
jgi:ABC-2 type transport system ATP-binding protein